MRKYFIIGLGIIILNNLNVYSQKSNFFFNQKGEFKIVQFTDLHIMREGTDSVFDLVKEIIELENPDLVVLTGDISVQDTIEASLLRLATIFADHKIYWASVLGNHDDEWGPERRVLSKLYRSLPYNLNAYTSGISGETNFLIPVSGAKGNKQAILYFFDSNSYNLLKSKVKGEYGWIAFSQIQWYRNQSSSFTKKNKGIPVPSLSFFHIPLPEYKELWANDSISCIGSKHEEVACPLVNSGLYTAMLECGDVMGTFTGHDHINDYIGNLNGIALAYGRFSGTKNTYGFLTPGARVIVLKEGKREFDTWIREKGGKQLYQCHFPDSFNKMNVGIPTLK